MTATASPYVKLQFFDANGDPANGYQLFTYDSGTATKKNTWSDAGQLSLNANPIVLDSSGRCSIFLAAGESYKYVLALPTDSDPPASPVWSVDAIQAVPSGSLSADADVAATAGETLAAGDSVYESDGSGGTTAGRWYKTDADAVASSSGAQKTGFATAAISTGSAGTVRVAGRVTGLSGLVAGTVYYASATAGALTSTAPTNARIVGQADTTTTLVVVQGIGVATASIPGCISLTTQTLGAGTKSVDKLTYKPGGVTTFDANASGRILGPYVTSQATSTTTETSTIGTPPTIKANTLNASGDVLRATYVGIASANSNATTWRVKLGGTTITTFTFTPNATAASWKLVIEIHRTSGATAQNITSTLLWSENNTASTSPFVDCQQATKDLATDLTLDVTIQRAVAGSVTFKGAYFEGIGL